jgi:photosystem II stability/assembly factor-like uncharacterized protein
MNRAKRYRTTYIGCSLAALLSASLFTGAGDAMQRREIREDDRERPASDRPDEALKFRRLQLQDERGYIPLDGLLKASAHVEAMKAAQQKRLKTQSKTGAQQGVRPQAAGVQPNSWTWLGPGNVGGRIRSIVIHPTNPNSMWVGSVSGGIWHSGDGGNSWQPVNDFMANLDISTMAINPVNPNIMYAGTGEGFTTEGFTGDAIQGLGVFRSTDGGVTWKQLPKTNPADPSLCADAGPNCSWSYVNRLAISPNGSTLLAATANGIWGSSDGGANWSLSEGVGGGRLADIDFDPTNSQKAIASGYGAALFSTNGGRNWDFATFNPQVNVDLCPPKNCLPRVELAYAPSNTSIVYATVDLNKGDLYRSIDGGQTYNRVNTGTSFFVSKAGDQGGYDNIVWVNPRDERFVVVGGIDLFRSTDSGQTFTQISRWQCGPGNPDEPCSGQSAHADQHMIVAHPGFNNTTNKVVYFSNDGGLFRTDDVSTVRRANAVTGRPSGWINMNNGLGITQFYGAAANPNTGQIMGGAQDNGTVIFNGVLGSPWHTTFGGDGGFCAADPRDRVAPLYFYGETPNAAVFRSVDGGASGSYIYCDPALIDSTKNPSGVCPAGKGLDDARNGANFVAPLTLDPNNPDTLLVGGLSLWRSRDVKTTPVPTWEAIKPPAPILTRFTIDVPISTITVSPNTSSFILVGDNIGRIFLTLQGGADAATVKNSWRQISNGLPARFVTSLAIDNTRSPNWIYATFGGFSPGNVHRSTDLGKTWQDVSGSGLTGLPDVPVRSIAIHPRNPNLLYVGTEMGIFTSEDAGATWEVPQDGPANVSVDQVFWVTESFGADDLIAVTHGRGIYIASGGIYVDASYTGLERGTFLQPFRTIPPAVAAAKTYQPIWIKAGTYNDRLTIGTPLELRSRGGTAVVGKQP